MSAASGSSGASPPPTRGSNFINYNRLFNSGGPLDALNKYRAGRRAQALWEWGFGFEHHWGRHAAGAIRALHCWLVVRHTWFGGCRRVLSGTPWSCSPAADRSCSGGRASEKINFGLDSNRVLSYSYVMRYSMEHKARNHEKILSM